METGDKSTQNSAELGKILEQGENIHGERTGTGTRSLFGPQIEFSAFCKLKKCDGKEMIRGETVGFWSANCERDFLDGRGLTEYQDLGPIYGHQFQRNV